MEIKEVHKWEKAVVVILNIIGWDLKWIGDEDKSWDAEGLSPKNRKVVIEMKFREKYYEEKLLEKYKYDVLMKLPDDIVKLYFVNDPKANYMFWLDSLEMPDPVKLYCPSTTIWNNKKVKKEVYLLKENWASIINLNTN